jgi:uncharacterized protein YggE
MACRVALVIALVALGVPAEAQDNPTQLVPTIVTTGTATIQRAPDQAFVAASVEARAKSPQEAQRQNAAAMTSVQQRVASLGIARESTRTLGYTIQQEVDFVDGRRVVRGFLARNALEIRVDNLERLGEAIDAVVQAGATSISDIRFDLRDRAGAEREALRNAVADARARADAIAAGANRTVDRVLRIEDALSPAPPPRPVMMGMAARDAQVETPIEPGRLEIRAHVTLTVTIK